MIKIICKKCFGIFYLEGEQLKFLINSSLSASCPYCNKSAISGKELISKSKRSLE